MRIGVDTGNGSPDEGGGFTFTRAVVDAIMAYSSSHVFIIWDGLQHVKRGRIELIKRVVDRVNAGRLIRSGVRVLRSAWPAFAAGDVFSAVSPIEKFINYFDIDLFWFLHPVHPTVSVPYLTTVWDLQHRRQPFFPEVSITGWTWEARELSYRSNLPQAARVITGTEAGKNEIIAFYGVSPDNISVVPMPVMQVELSEDDGDRKAIKAKYGLKKEYLLYPAQFWPHKNHVNLLHALYLLKKNTGLELDLMLTGSDRGNLTHVRETIAALGLTSQVHIPGFVPNADLAGLYREALCLTFASFFGPDNIPPLEAFFLGCPVTAARVPGSEEQLEGAAVLFNPADPADIAQAILAVHDDAGLRSELIRRGREVVATRSPRAYVEQICRILDDFEPIRRCWGRHYSHL